MRRMAMYVVSYDLREGATVEDYQRIGEALRGLGAEKVLLSQWALRSSFTADTLRDHLATFMDGNDRLLVTQVLDWAGYRLMADMNTL